MAAELRFRHQTTEETLYFTVRLDTNFQYWNGAGTEALTPGNWTNYKVSMTETPASGYLFTGTIPNTTAIPAGWYHLDIFKQLTSTATISDPIQASMFGYWDTSSYKIQGADVTQGAGFALVVKGTVISTAFSPTATEFESSELNASAAGHYTGRAIVFTSGTLKDQATSISSYVKTGSYGHFYVAATTSAAANTDSFVIV